MARREQAGLGSLRHIRHETSSAVLRIDRRSAEIRHQAPRTAQGLQPWLFE